MNDWQEAAYKLQEIIQEVFSVDTFYEWKLSQFSFLIKKLHWVEHRKI